MTTLTEFREEIRKEIGLLLETVPPDGDLFPMLMIPKDEDIDPESGKPLMVLMHVGEFFHDEMGKDVFVKFALPVLLHKLEAKRVALVAPTWMGRIGPDELPDGDERDRIMALLNRGGLAAIPAKYKKEGVMVRISDGVTELAGMADLTRHEGSHPTVEWNSELEMLFDPSRPLGPKDENTGRMRNGFLIQAFTRARMVTDDMVKIAERLLGMGYWQPNPDDTPELFKK